jgi:hypothetical protein
LNIYNFCACFISLNCSGYGWSKKRRLRGSATVFLLKRFNCFCDEYEFIEMGTSKTVFWAGHTHCFPEYSFANGWQSKRFFFDGNKMVKVQEGNKRIVTVWEFSEDTLVMTVQVDNVVARKYYARTHDSISGVYSCLEQFCIN